MTRDLFSISAEQSILGGIMRDNNAVDRISSLEAAHFYRADHRAIFEEMLKQIVAGRRVDAITLAETLKDDVTDCLQYLISLHGASSSAANIVRHAQIVSDRAMLRSLLGFGMEVQDAAANAVEPALIVFGRLAQKLDALGQCKDDSEPVRADLLLADYADLLEKRMSGAVRPIPTGFADLDRQLDGGLERGTLTVVAGRPAMGKTAFGLGVARNVATDGAALFLSMEMSEAQVNDRNIAALGGIPISWLRKPQADDEHYWSRMTAAFIKAQALDLFIDDKTALSVIEIRAKARSVKRRHGLDVLVIDQLSFIAGGSNENKAYDIGEHTRGLVALSKELDCAVVLLAQLNRDCEKRQNRRPMMADLAMSGSIEQDAANVVFLYRDEVYNPDTRDKGICEVITGKQRQGAIGTVALNYVGSQTKFEDLQYPWAPAEQKERPKSRGFE
jgi:replicative DNA helicase